MGFADPSQKSYGDKKGHCRKKRGKRSTNCGNEKWPRRTSDGLLDSLLPSAIHFCFESCAYAFILVPCALVLESSVAGKLNSLSKFFL